MAAVPIDVSATALYPSLRYGNSRWWLPIGETTITLIGRMILASEDPPSSLMSELMDAFRSDPTLFLYVSLRRSLAIAEEATVVNGATDSASTVQAVCVDEFELARWFTEHVGQLFSSGDAFLGEPTVSAAQKQRFEKLRAHYLALSKTDWMRDAPLWLEVLGPPVPVEWHRVWPEIEFEDPQATVNHLAHNMDAENGEDARCRTDHSSHFLQQLARTTRHFGGLRSVFDQRLHRDKLRALKQLAYGLSHEINNPLANISTRAQQLQREETDPDRHATLQRIVDQVYRAHEMIADLMFYANPNAPVLRRCDLSQVIQGVVEEFAGDCESRQIKLESRGCSSSAWVQGDKVMLNQAIGGLIRNSFEAIGHGGTILVSLETRYDSTCREDSAPCDEIANALHGRAGQGKEMDGRPIGPQTRPVAWQVRVADSGPGLSDQDREHAFDPYYSGREAGRGLGLGLCRVYRIVKLHGGQIRLAGGPAGCVATVNLPAI